MTRETPIAQQPDKCWASQEHKHNIELLVRESVRNGNVINTTFIASSIVSDDEVLPADDNSGADIHELLNWAEEAYRRLV